MAQGPRSERVPFLMSAQGHRGERRRDVSEVETAVVCSSSGLESQVPSRPSFTQLPVFTV